MPRDTYSKVDHLEVINCNVLAQCIEKKIRTDQSVAGSALAHLLEAQVDGGTELIGQY